MLSQSERIQRGRELKGLAGEVDAIADIGLDAEPEPTVIIVGNLIAVVNKLQAWASAYGQDASDNP